MSTAVIWSKSKPDVEFQYGGRLGEFNGMSSQSHLPHCRVLPLGELNVLIPKPRVTLQGAATWWIPCDDSRATCHIAGCSHLAKSMSWSCHIAGCNNSICHVKNRFSPYFIFYFCLFKCSLGFDEWQLSYHLRYTCYIHYTIATLYFGEIGACSMCCQKLVIAQKYSAKVQLYSFGPRSAPSTKTSASAEHYKGIVGAPLGNMCEKETPECKQAIDVIFDFWKKN